ncbi:MAG: NAD(P)-dependent oxidoreductase, partial [Aestuariivirga sp.]
MRDRRPLGLITSDAEALKIARRLAGTGHRVLYYTVAPLSVREAGPNLEAAATPTDIAIECEIVAFAIDDTRSFRQILLGTPDRPGMAADMLPGTTLI